MKTLRNFIFACALIAGSLYTTKASAVIYSDAQADMVTMGLTEVSWPSGWTTTFYGYSEVHFWQMLDGYGNPTGSLWVFFVWSTGSSDGYAAAGTTCDKTYTAASPGHGADCAAPQASECNIDDNCLITRCIAA